MRVLLYLTLILSISFSLCAQNLLEERIRKITTKKRSVFLDKGIFHNGTSDVNSKLMKVRHSFSPQRGYERVVFDFNSDKMPKIYGYISKAERKLYIDFFNTEIATKIGSFGNSKFVEKVSFFPISKESLSVELTFKGNARVDVFYLTKPGRLVIDIKI